MVQGSDGTRSGLQSRAYKLLMSFESGHWVRFLRNRLEDLCPCEDCAVTALSDSPFGSSTHQCLIFGSFKRRVDELRSVLTKASAKGQRLEVFAVLRTLANAWSTTSRYQEARQWCCIFGCDARDNLEHYICCDPLWTICACHLNCPALVLDWHIGQRVCIDRPTSLSISLCGTAFWLYHTLKLRYKGAVESFARANDPAGLAMLAFEVLPASPIKLRSV